MKPVIGGESQIHIHIDARVLGDLGPGDLGPRAYIGTVAAKQRFRALGPRAQGRGLNRLEPI